MIYLMDIEAAIKYIDNNKIAAIIEYYDNDDIIMYESDSIKKYKKGN